MRKLEQRMSGLETISKRLAGYNHYKNKPKTDKQPFNL